MDTPRLNNNAKLFSIEELSEIERAVKVIANILKGKKPEGVHTSSFDGNINEHEHSISFNITITDND